MEHHTTRAFRKPDIRLARNRGREIHYHKVCHEKVTDKLSISTNDEVWGCTRSMGKRGQREKERREGGVRALPGLLCMTNFTIYHASKPPSERARERASERTGHKRRRRGEVMHHLFAAPLPFSGLMADRHCRHHRASDRTIRRRVAPPPPRPSSEWGKEKQVWKCMEDDAAGCGCGWRAGLAVSCNILESIVFRNKACVIKIVKI